MSSSGFYTAKEAARITKVPRSTVDYWARTGLIVPSQSRSRPKLYSFADLRDLAVADQLRKQGAGIPDQRKALTYVRSNSDATRLAQANFGVYEGRLIWADEEGNVVAPHRQGQGVFVVDMAKVFELLGITNPDVAQMRPSPRVLIDPKVRGGTPVIQGTRIPTALIVELHDDGMTDKEIIAMYPSLVAADIAAALEWEEAGARLVEVSDSGVAG